MRLAIDFDGVLHDDRPGSVVPGYKMGPPTDGAVAAIQRLKQYGHNIIVFTVRATTKSGQDAVMNWLDYFDIPYDTVTAVKPNADVFLDDHAYRFGPAHAQQWATFIADLPTL